MTFFGVHVDGFTREEARARLNEKQLIFTPNPEILLEASRNAAYRAALQKGTLMLPDGNGLQLTSMLMKIRSRGLRFLVLPLALVLFLFRKCYFRGVFPEIIHGSDFMWDVVQKAEQEGWPVFFLGAKPGVADKTAAFFRSEFPCLKVAGVSSAHPSEAAFQEVLASKAHVLFVAYGAPKQELWLAEYAPQLPSLRIGMGVGGSFDFYSGEVKRAPGFMRKLGIEWMWRLLMNPLQRAKRIWNAVVVFPILTILE